MDKELSLVESQKPRFFYGYIIVVVCFIMTVVWWGTFLSFGVFFESLLVEFGWNRAVTATAASLHGVLWTVLGILIARLVEKSSPRLVIAVCGFLGGLGYILMPQITAVWQMYLLYGLAMSIGMGAWVTILPIVARWFVQRRGLMTGVVYSGQGIGMVIIPMFASQLISAYDWRMTYIIVGLTVIVVIVAGAQFLKSDPYQAGILPYGGNRTNPERPASEDRGYSYREALRTGRFWLVGALFFIVLACQATITVHIVIHATGMGVTAIRAAQLLSIFGVFIVLGMNVFGIIADRIGNRSTFPIGFILIAIAFLLLVLTKDICILYLVAGIMGFACAGVHVVFSPVLAELFGLRSHGVIFATANCIGGFGSAVGTTLSGYIFDVSDSYSLAFIIFAITAVVAVAISLLLKSINSEGTGTGKTPINA